MIKTTQGTQDKISCFGVKCTLQVQVLLVCSSVGGSTEVGSIASEEKQTATIQLLFGNLARARCIQALAFVIVLPRLTMEPPIHLVALWL